MYPKWAARGQETVAFGGAKRSAGGRCDTCPLRPMKWVIIIETWYYSR
jgi:hypothetical protein